MHPLVCAMIPKSAACGDNCVSSFHYGALPLFWFVQCNVFCPVLCLSTPWLCPRFISVALSSSSSFVVFLGRWVLLGLVKDQEREHYFRAQDLELSLMERQASTLQVSLLYTPCRCYYCIRPAGITTVFAPQLSLLYCTSPPGLCRRSTAPADTQLMSVIACSCSSLASLAAASPQKGVT